MNLFLYRMFCGFFLGISIFAPGVSGSVMAVMMGIYDDLLTIVANPFKNLKKNIIYLIPMGIGAVISLIAFVFCFDYLFATYEKATYYLFMGLIIGNIPLVFNKARSYGFKYKYLLGTVIAFGIAVTIGLIEASTTKTITTVSIVTIAIAGAVAGIASMVPGTSISIILMLFGVYEYLLDAVKNIDIMVIGVVGTCFLLGMVVFSNITKYILEHYPSIAYFIVGGFMCGSVVSIYLLPKSDLNYNPIIGIIAIIAGLIISYLFVFMSKKLNLDD